MSNDLDRAAYYREQASQIRTFADGELNSPLRSVLLLDIARQYEETAAELESGRVGQAA